MKFSTQYDLYLGRDIRSGGSVQHPELYKFLADHVTERFPGFTVLDAHSFWKGKPEQVVILRILGDSVDGFAVNKIAADYRRAFKQDAVLVVKTSVTGALV